MKKIALGLLAGLLLGCGVPAAVAGDGPLSDGDMKDGLRITNVELDGGASGVCVTAIVDLPNGAGIALDCDWHLYS